MSSDRLTVLEGGSTSDEREARLADGADELARGRVRGSLIGNQRLLLTISGGLMTFGVCLILLGWLGAAHSTLVEEQVPYLISGGLLGVALALIGAVTLFAHWLTVLVRENRAHEVARRQDHDELVGAIRDLTDALQRREVSGDGRVGGDRARRPIRRAPRGS